MTINTFEKHISKVKCNMLPITTNNDHGLNGDRFQNIMTVRKNNSSRKGMSKCGKNYYSGLHQKHYRKFNHYLNSGIEQYLRFGNDGLSLTHRSDSK